MLHGQQVHIALAGDIKGMPMRTNKLFSPGFEPHAVYRASQIIRLENIHG